MKTYLLRRLAWFVVSGLLLAFLQTCHKAHAACGAEIIRTYGATWFGAEDRQIQMYFFWRNSGCGIQGSGWGGAVFPVNGHRYTWTGYSTEADGGGDTMPAAVWRYASDGDGDHYGERAGYETTWGSAPAPEYWWNHTYCNNNLAPVIVSVRDVALAGFGDDIAYAGLQPGECYTFHLGPYEIKPEFFIELNYENTDSPFLVTAPIPGGWTTNAAGGTPSTAGPTASTVPSVPQQLPGSRDATNITFSTNGTTAARDQTLAEGFSGLRSAAVQIGDQAHRDANAILGKLDGVKTFTNGLTVQQLQSLTNLQRIADTNGQGAAGIAAGTAQGGALATVGTSQSGRTFEAPSGAGWGSFTIASAGQSWTGNWNPLNNAALAEFATFARLALLWVLVVVYIQRCMKVVEDYIRASTAAQQARAAGTSVLGNSLNTPIALGMAALITVAIAALPALFLSIGGSLAVAGVGSGSLWSMFITNPLAGATGVVASGIGAFNSVAPLAECLILSAFFIGFRFTAAGIYTIATTAVRFFVG